MEGGSCAAAIGGAVDLCDEVNDHAVGLHPRHSAHESSRPT